MRDDNQLNWYALFGALGFIIGILLVISSKL